MENERRAESLRNDVVFRRAVRNVPHYGRSALFRGLPQVDQHDHPRRNHDRRIGFDGRNLVPWQDAPNRTDVSGDGDLRDGNLDEVPVSNVAPDRRQPLCGRTGNQPLQRPARLDVAERRMVVVLRRPDGRTGTQPPAVPGRGDELLRSQRSARTDDHSLLGRDDHRRRRRNQPVRQNEQHRQDAFRTTAENQYGKRIPGTGERGGDREFAPKRSLRARTAHPAVEQAHCHQDQRRTLRRLHPAGHVRFDRTHLERQR